VACLRRLPIALTYRSLRSFNSSPGAIGRHDFDLKTNVVRKRLFGHPQSAGCRHVENLQ